MPTAPNVKSFNASDSSGKPMRFTVSTDIIDYMQSARTFGLEDLGDVEAHGRFQRRVVAIPDRSAMATAPMVLTIGSDGGLYLVRQGSADGAGWKRLDLRKSFPASAGEKAKTRAVAANWSEDGRIAVAVAIDDPIAGGASRLFVAYDLDTNPAGTDWEKIAWTDCGTRGNLKVEGLRLLDNGDKTWTLVLNCDATRVDTLYIMRSDAPQQFDRALVFGTPVDYQEIYDFQAMVDPFRGVGIAMLGRSGLKTVLKFRPLPRIDRGWSFGSVPPEVPLPCPDGARVLRVVDVGGRVGLTDRGVGGGRRGGAAGIDAGLQLQVLRVRRAFAGVAVDLVLIDLG